jgi:hypothetical protein
MHQAYASGEFSIDEYAICLSNLLLHYDSVPERFTKGIPRISSAEVLATIDTLWPRLHMATRERIARDLPKYAKPSQPEEFQ